MVNETNGYTVNIEPNRVWEFAQKKKLMSDCKKFILASTKDGYEVCLNLENEEPEIEAYYDNEVIESAFVFDEKECTEYVRELFVDYITSEADDNNDAEIEDAFEAFVVAVVGMKPCMTMQEYKNYSNLLEEFTERIFEEADLCEEASLEEAQETA